MKLKDFSFREKFYKISERERDLNIENYDT